MARPSLTAVVRAALKSNPCSAAALARAAALSPAAVTKIKQGKMRVAPDTARRIALSYAAWAESCTAASRQIVAHLPLGGTR